MGLPMIIYHYDDDPLHMVDITNILTDGYTLSVQRNHIPTMQCKIRLRALLQICDMQSIDISDFLCEWFSKIEVIVDGDYQFGGVLGSYPDFTGKSLDSDISLTFQGFLGLLQGGEIEPVQVLTGRLDSILVSQVMGIIGVSERGRARYPMSIGHADALPSVTWTVDSELDGYTFVTQRCDNSDGSGNFDINVTPTGVFEIWQHYGSDISASTILQVGGSASNVEDFDFPEWNEYYTDVILSGSGNGYGSQGTTLTARAYNAQSRARHYYYCHVAQDSSISNQQTLDNAATKSLKYSSTPSATPTVTINATRLGLRVREHAQNGDIWVGDTIRIITSGIYSHYPLYGNGLYRIDKMDITVSGLGVTVVKMQMISPTGDDVSVAG